MSCSDALLASNSKFPPYTGNSQTWSFARFTKGHSYTLLSYGSLGTLLRACICALLRSFEPLCQGAHQGGHATARFLEGFLEGSLTASAS